MPRQQDNSRVHVVLKGAAELVYVMALREMAGKTQQEHVLCLGNVRNRAVSVCVLFPEQAYILR